MRNKTKKLLFPTLCALLCAATGFAVSQPASTVAKAEETAISSQDLEIAGKTLTISNNINVSFFLPESLGDNVNMENVKIHVTEKEKSGNVTATLSVLPTLCEYPEGNYYEYIYKGVTAYQMANELYAFAYLDNDGIEGLSAGDIKGPEVKYSVIEYAYKKLGKVPNKAKDETPRLESLLKNMLAYGSSAAVFADKTLPEDFSFENDYVYVSLMNAVFEDNYSYGFFKKGEQLTVTANTGYELSETPNAAFAKDGDTIIFTVPDENFVEDKDTSSFVDNSANISAADKVAYEKSLIAVNTEAAYVGDSITLNSTPDAYEDVTITWSTTGAALSENVVTFDTVGQATLTATLSCGDVEETVSFNVDVTVNPYPVENKAYMLKTTSGTEYYAIGTSSSYLNTANNQNTLLNVYFKNSGDTYYLYYMVDDTNVKYIEHSATTSLKYVSGTVDGAIPGDCNGWTLDVENHQIVSNVDSNRSLAYNTTSPRFSTYAVSATYIAVWFEEIRELTDAEKAQKAGKAFEFDVQELTGETTTTLETEAGEATITWSATHANVTLDGNVLTTTNPDEDTEFTLRATFTVNEAEYVVDYVIALNHYESGSNQPVSNKYDADFSAANTGSSYKDFTTSGGWTTNGRNDASIKLDSTATSICIAKSKSLVSPTLTTGIQSLSFKYGCPFADTAMDASVYIKQNGTIVAEYTIKHSVTKNAKTIYTFDTANINSTNVTVVKELTAITGNFTIEIKNNSSSTRPSIWSLSWYSYEL